MQTFSRKLVHIAAAVLLLAGGNACNELDPVSTFEPITDASKIFLSLTLNHRAINLAIAEPWNQVKLIATPRNGLGQPMSGLPQVTYRSSDTTRVHVTDDGLVTARAVGNNVLIVAEILTSDNIRRVDSARVNVRATPQQLATFTIDPELPEQAVWSLTEGTWSTLGTTFLRNAGLDLRSAITLRALDQGGLPVTGLQVSYESLDPEVTFVNPGGNIVMLKPGQVRVVASTFAYGVALSDTATFTVMLPRVYGILFAPQPDSTFVLSAKDIIVRPGGHVFWFNQSLATPISVTFDNPAAASEVPELCAWFGAPLCGGGNIAEFNGNRMATTPPMTFPARARRFTTPGVYTYHTSNGLTGTIRVATEEELQ